MAHQPVPSHFQPKQLAAEAPELGLCSAGDDPLLDPGLPYRFNGSNEPVEPHSIELRYPSSFWLGLSSSIELDPPPY